MSNGFSMKSGGVLWSPTSTKALPGSDRLVPNTTIPEKRDCAAANPGAANTRARQLTSAQRLTGVVRLSILTMM
jgi:hypothetical protein